ncbi:MAG TPA: 1,2-phenylacetyl-CoA epoxidase subunit PaaE [Acidisphaera sp.]|nr:1,2-phenylacetyl-CoA epoxidase subunit PaaE [Acidisphaera sp.]
MSAETLSEHATGAGPRFHWLRVAEVQRETPEAISVTFDIPPALAPLYAFRAGQYLTLRTTLDGEEVRRSYSICSGVDDGELRIAIKRVEAGVFSVWAQEALAPGVAIEAMTPVGRFGIPDATDAARVHVAFAAGSGITPVLSIMKTVLAREPRSRFFLFYGSRTTGEILFRGTLEDLKDRYLGRLSVFHVLSQEQQDVDVLNGRLDREKLRTLLPLMLGGTKIDHAYICGPSGMMESIERALAEFGVPPERVHIERFTSVAGGRPRAPVAIKADAPPFAMATLIRDGAHTEVPVAVGESIVDAGLRAGLDLPFSCKGGMCSTCRAKVVEGSVEMEQNYALEPWETQAGYVLTCQARPTTARVVVDYDQQ